MVLIIVSIVALELVARIQGEKQINGMLAMLTLNYACVIFDYNRKTTCWLELSGRNLIDWVEMYDIPTIPDGFGLSF